MGGYSSFSPRRSLLAPKFAIVGFQVSPILESPITSIVFHEKTCMPMIWSCMHGRMSRTHLGETGPPEMEDLP